MKPCNNFDLKKDLEFAAGLLQNHGIVGIPTETVYGLAASIFSVPAIEKIFKIKERPFFDPLIVHISSIEQLQLLTPEYANPIVIKLATAFWPGPLTMVLPKIESINTMITSGLSTIAIRLPKHPVAISLINMAGSPLAAPSANKFGKTSPTSWEHVRQSFPTEDLFVLDGGSSEIGIESTVIRPNLENGNFKIDILRPGIITKDDLMACVGDKFQIDQTTSIASPGSDNHHYMPNIPLALVENELSHDNLIEVQKKLARTIKNVVELKLDENGTIAARQLYHELRQSSLGDPDLIFFRAKNASGEIWNSIMDRITRAATFDFRQ